MKRNTLILLIIFCFILSCTTLRSGDVTAGALEEEAYNFYSEGNYAEAERLLLQVLEIRKTLPPEGKNPDYIDSLNNLGILYVSMGDYNKAEAPILQALEIGKNLPPAGKHPFYVKSLNNLAELYRSMGDYRRAELLYHQALEIGKNLSPEGKHPFYAESLYNLAILYIFMGVYNKSEPLFLQALEIRKNLPPIGKYPEYAPTLNSLALLYQLMGDYSKAEPLYLQALELGKKLPPEGKHPNYVTTVTDLAGLYKSMGNYDKAEPLFLQIIDIFCTFTPKGKHPSYATSLNNLAELYSAKGDYSKAEPLYHQALEIQKNMPPEGKHPYYASTLNNLAELYSAKGDYSKAEPLYHQTLEILKTLPPEGKNPRYAISLNNLAKLYGTMGNYDKAEQLFFQALEIRKTLPPAGKHKDYAATLGDLAGLYHSMGNYLKAESFILECLSISREFLHTNFSAQSEKEKEHFLATLAQRFEYFYSFLEKRLTANPNLADTAANLQLFSGAILFRSSKAVRRYIQNSDDKELSRDYESWIGIRRQINKTYELSDEQRAARLIDLEALTEESNRLEKSLTTRSEEFQLAYAPKEHSWQEVRSSLKPGEAALSLVRYRLYDKQWTDTIHYAVIIIKSDSPHPEIFFMKNGNIIEEEIIPLYRDFITETGYNADIMQDARTFEILYTNLWQPLAAKLENIHRVYFSPDGMLNLINPATLQWTPGSWLGEKWDIVRVTSLLDLIEKPRGSRGVTTPPLLVGYPLYSLDDEARLQAVKKYVPESREAGYEKIPYRTSGSLLLLPGSREEVESLAILFRQMDEEPEVHLEEAALEECIKAARNPRVLHLATHAFFQEDLNAGTDPQFKGLENLQMEEDPMLRSGLLFSGAANTLEGREPPAGLENGILTAREILDLEMENTELVVLSACETGLGVIKNGEGVYGLQRAFLVAGADAVLMSLWKVHDLAARDFMVEFYRNWLSGKSKQEAYEEAVVWMKSMYPAPYYWGAFVLVGI